MENEIEFPENLQEEETPKEDSELKELKARLSKMESSLTQLMEKIDKFNAKLQETPEEKPEEKTEAKTEEPKVDEEKAEMAKKIDDLTKKLEELEKEPVRLTQPTSDSNIDTNERVKAFTNQVTGGEMLVYAEKNGKKWGINDE
jgi:predicted  nucleic acid-binding Zn-ribbon protein